MHLDAVEPDVAVECPRRQREVELEVVQVPAQAPLEALALTDQVVAVVGEQAHVALRAGEARLGQSGSRSAARATHSASIGSLLPWLRAEARALAISLGGTRARRSPRGSRWRSRRPETWRQSSTR